MVEKIYEVIKSIYPNLRTDVWGEPESVLVFVSRVEYFPSDRLSDENKVAVMRKDVSIEVHFYSSEAREYSKFERAISSHPIRLSDPDRIVPVRIERMEIVSLRPFEVVFYLRARDYVFADISPHERGLKRELVI